MRNRELIFVVVTVLVLSCLTLAGPGVPREDKALYDEYQTLSRIVSAVTRNYVEEVDVKKLFYGAYDGMLNTLDPYSAFLPPAEKEDLEVETKGEFGGLGIEITLDKAGVLTVITPLEDTPAFKAGVLAGDRIVKIEGVSTKGISLRDAVGKLRGPKGKPVTITVLHENGKFEDVTVVRDIIRIQSIKDPRFVDDAHKIAYVRLSQFQANSAENLDAAVAELRKRGMEALVLDLRFNPGGLLKAAIEVGDRFIANGTIVSTKDRNGRGRVYRAGRNSTYDDFPLALLVSGRSASASEIVAGAIQDHRRGILVGTRTFGKASVQTLLKLEDGKSAIRLTTAHYYTPAGRLIHHNFNNPKQKKWGIDPDIEVPVTPQEEIDLWNHWRDEHLRQSRENNNEPAKPDDKPKTETPPAPEPPPGADAPKDGDGTAAPAKPFEDRCLNAAVNALKGMLLAREHAERHAAAVDAK